MSRGKWRTVPKAIAEADRRASVCTPSQAPRSYALNPLGWNCPAETHRHPAWLSEEVTEHRSGRVSWWTLSGAPGLCQDASSSPRSVLPRGHRAGLASSCLDVRTQYLLRSSRPCHLLRQVPGAPVSQQQGRHLHTLDPSMLVETRSQCALYPWWPAENS